MSSVIRVVSVKWKWMGAAPGFIGWRNDGRVKRWETASSVHPPPPRKELVTTLHPSPVPFSTFADLSFLN